MQEPTAQGFEWRIMPDGERAAGRAGEGGATGLLAADGSGGAAGHPAEADGQPPTVYTPSNPVSDALRSPQSLKEGPCECDLYLSCAKFVTTPEYAPRLRVRRVRELELMEDAAARGWEREVERHKCTTRRIEQLLMELGEPIGEQQGAGDV